jgi:hypothetical protein
LYSGRGVPAAKQTKEGFPMPASVPARFQRPEGARDAAPPADHPTTRNFLNYHSSLEEEVRRQANQLDADAVKIAMLQARLDDRERELAITKVERDKYSKGYFHLQAQLSVVTSTAIAAAKNVGDTCLQALEETKGEMRRAGMAGEPSPETQQLIDDGVEKLGRIFGANARTDDETAEAA